MALFLWNSTHMTVRPAYKLEPIESVVLIYEEVAAISNIRETASLILSFSTHPKTINLTFINTIVTSLENNEYSQINKTILEKTYLAKEILLKAIERNNLLHEMTTLHDTNTINLPLKHRTKKFSHADMLRYISRIEILQKDYWPVSLHDHVKLPETFSYFTKPFERTFTETEERAIRIFEYLTLDGIVNKLNRTTEEYVYGIESYLVTLTETLYDTIDGYIYSQLIDRASHGKLDRQYLDKDTFREISKEVLIESKNLRPEILLGDINNDTIMEIASVRIGHYFPYTFVEIEIPFVEQKQSKIFRTHPL